MPEWVVYLVKFNTSIALVFLFYWLVLRKMTFYSWNRWFLLGYSCLCFLMPFANIDPILVQTKFSNNDFVQSIPVFSGYLRNSHDTFPVARSQFNSWNLFSYLLDCGFLVMTVRLILQFFAFMKIRRLAKLVSKTPVKLYQVEQNIIPFSFGKGIFINPANHRQDELGAIINHEFIHVKQKHSIDILFTELLCIFAWYNPFAWLMRHAIRQNLEFIADNYVLNKGADKKKYQYLLLKVMGVSPIGITNSFNFSSLKKRILMMNKIKTAGTHLIKFALILPLVLVLLLAFRHQSSVSPQVNNSSAQDTLPEAKPQPAIVASAPILPKAAIAAPIPSGDAMSISIDKNNKATVELKNGKIKIYDLNKPADKAAFETKYGQAPQPTIELEISAVTVAANVSTTVASVATLPAIAANINQNEVAVTAPATVTLNVNEELATTVGTEDKFSVKGHIVLEISKNTSREKMEQIVDDLRKRGYDFRIRDMKFENGVLISIDGSLAKGLTISHFIASDFSGVIITESTNKNEEHSFRFYVEKGKLIVK